MRKAPEFAPPAVVPQQDAEYITQERKYRLITPLYGGGAVAQEADAVTVVRVPSIRGQLRFWWRACRGAGEDNSPQRLRAAEKAIWGMAGDDQPVPSHVSLRLKLLDGGRKRSWRDIRDVDYAIFPLRGSNHFLVEDVAFALTVTYPAEKAADVMAAFWAWETFGGLGARTRRGFGAVQCVAVDGKEVVPPDAQKLDAAIRQGLIDHVKPGQWHPHLPHLAPNMALKVTPVKAEPVKAWSYLIDKLKSFRQQRTGSQGRSLWPEPDAIRDLTGQSAPAHSRPMTPGIKKFPRAQFGLPIIFHFRRDGNRHGDPDDTTLEGEGSDRFASPLILRPVAALGGRACGLAVVLEGPRVPSKGLVLKQGRRDLATMPPYDAAMTQREADLIKPLNHDMDILQAFLATL